MANVSAISEIFSVVRTRINKSKWMLSAASSCLVLLLCSQTVISADISKTTKSTSTTTGEGEFAFRELKKYEPLPDLPQYSGQADFVQGVVYPQAKGGTSTTYSMCAREGKDAVVRWYQDALKMYKWNMAGQQSSDGVRGFKGGNYIQVAVTPPPRRGYGCEIIITYRTAAQ